MLWRVRAVRHDACLEQAHRDWLMLSLAVSRETDVGLEGSGVTNLQGAGRPRSVIGTTMFAASPVSVPNGERWRFTEWRVPRETSSGGAGAFLWRGMPEGLVGRSS